MNGRTQQNPKQQENVMQNLSNTWKLRGKSVRNVTKSFLVAISLVASVTLSRANITNAWLYSSDNSIMSCTYSWLPSDPNNFGVVGTQYSTASALLRGYVYTDTPTDPTLNLGQNINNDTGIAWSDYHVQISMAQSFSFTNVGVSNPGWTFSVVNPTFNGTSYVGEVNYLSGTPVANGGLFVFNLGISFVGSVVFTETATPSFVPEPTTVCLGAVGGLLLLAARLRRNR
jgi:hypothetical protein